MYLHIYIYTYIHIYILWYYNIIAYYTTPHYTILYDCRPGVGHTGPEVRDPRHRAASARGLGELRTGIYVCVYLYIYIYIYMHICIYCIYIYI